MIENKITNELFDKLISTLFEEVCNNVDLEYEQKDKHGNETYKYDFDKNKFESSKNDMKDNPGKIMVDKDGYEALLDLKDKLRSKIDTLQREKEELIRTSKQVSDSGHKVADNNLKLQRLINDKLYADGYKIMNDIKIYIEFARKCDAFKNSGFRDMINSIAKVANDFIASQTEHVFC